MAYSLAWAWPSALASLAPSAVTAVENAGSWPGRPGGHWSHTASSTRRAARPAMLRQKVMGPATTPTGQHRAARPAMLRQKVMGPATTPTGQHDMTITAVLQPDQ